MRSPKRWRRAHISLLCWWTVPSHRWLGGHNQPHPNSMGGNGLTVLLGVCVCYGRDGRWCGGTCCQTTTTSGHHGLRDPGRWVLRERGDTRAPVRSLARAAHWRRSQDSRYLRHPLLWLGPRRPELTHKLVAWVFDYALDYLGVDELVDRTHDGVVLHLLIAVSGSCGHLARRGASCARVRRERRAPGS